MLGSARKERAVRLIIVLDTARKEERRARRRGPCQDGVEMSTDDPGSGEAATLARFVAVARLTRPNAWKSVERLKAACARELSGASPPPTDDWEIRASAPHRTPWSTAPMLALPL